MQDNATKTPPNELRQGQRLRVTLEGMGRLGEATVLVDGQRVFVIGGIPGEDVVIEVLRRRRDHVAAKVVEVITPSPDRVTAPCPYFGECTGCQRQHIAYERQLDLKRDEVRDAFARVGGMADVEVAPTLPSPTLYGYRNHARFTVKHGTLGFVNRETHRFVRIDRCLLMDEGINRLLAALQDKASETTQLSIRYGVNTGDFLIQPEFHSPAVTVPTGQTHYTEALAGRRLRVASPSFFQVNTRQAERLLDLARDRLRLTGREHVVDAYAGVGVFAIALAPHARKVTAIEESASAVRDARGNAEGVGNVSFVQGRTEDVLPALDDPPDAVVLDPPRTGCGPSALEALVRMRVSRVVYVSCDPSTLARDAKLLVQGGYRLAEVQPVDMFPHTHHVECVAVFTLPGGEARDQQADRASSDLVLASASPRRRELLQLLGVPFQVAPSDVDESLAGRSPEAESERLALAKARAASTGRSAGLVVGADTLVVSPTGEVLGKPRDAAEATAMLRALRGAPHRVITGVAVIDAASGREVAGHLTSTVWMRDYSDAEIEAYAASGRPMDKAGAYAVQDPGFRPADRVEGCYLNVIGLPVCLLRDLLRGAGLGLPDVDLPPACNPNATHAGEGETPWTSLA